MYVVFVATIVEQKKSNVEELEIENGWIELKFLKLRWSVNGE